MDVNIDTSDESLAGVYTVKVFGELAIFGGTFTSSAYQFTVDVKKCSDTTGSIYLTDADPLLPADITYVICTGQLDVQASLANYETSSTNECSSANIEYDYSVVPFTAGQTDSFFSFNTDASIRTLSIDSCDGNHIGWYTVTISAFVTAPSASPNDSLDQTFQVEVVADDADIWTPDIYEVLTY